jgi:hypothetical protein
MQRPIYGIGVFARGQPGLEVHIGAGPAQVTLMVSLIAGFLCFVYSWFVVLKMRAGKSFRWRDRIRFLALVIAPGAVFLRFIMPAFWGSDVGSKCGPLRHGLRLACECARWHWFWFLRGDLASSCPLS